LGGISETGWQIRNFCHISDFFYESHIRLIMYFSNKAQI